MTNARPYRPARRTSEALAELRRCAGTQFDSEVVEALADVVADSPPAWVTTVGVEPPDRRALPRTARAL